MYRTWYSESVVLVLVLLIASVALAGSVAAQADSTTGVEWADGRTSTTGDGGSTFTQNLVIEPTSSDSIRFGPEADNRIRVVNLNNGEQTTISPADSSPTVEISEFSIAPTRLRESSILPRLRTADGEKIDTYDVTLGGSPDTFFESTFSNYRVQIIDSSGSIIAETEESRIRGIKVSAPDEEVVSNGSVVRVPRDAAIDPDWEVILTQDNEYITTINNEAGESYFTFETTEEGFDEDKRFTIEVYPRTEFDEEDPFAELRYSEQIIQLFGFSVGEPPEEDPEAPPEDDPESDDPEEPRADKLELDSLEAPSKITTGEGYSVKATATNTDDEAISSEIIYLFLAPDGLIQTEQRTKISLEPGESTTVEFKISAEDTKRFAFGVGFGHAVVAPEYDELQERPIRVERGEPRFDDPRVDDPRVDDPRVDDPRFDDPRFDDPEDPRVDDPEDPRVDDPEDPRVDDPEDPRVDDPEDPRVDDPERPVSPKTVFDVARAFRAGEVATDELLDVVVAFRSGEPLPAGVPRTSSPPEPAADIESAESTFSTTTAELGETVTITADATFSGRAADAKLLQRIIPAVPHSNVEITSGGGSTIAAYRSASNGTILASYGGTNSVELEYEVTIPEDASVGTTYNLPGGVKLGSGTPERFSGDTTIEVVASGEEEEAAIDSAARTISKSSVLPGEEVNVTVDIAISGNGSVTLTESISPAPSEANVKAIDPGEGGTAASYDETAGEISATYEGVDAATLTYTLSIPDDAAGTTYDFAGVGALGDRSLTVKESDIASVTRDVSESTAAPGSTVSVSIDATFSSGSDSYSITDEIDPALDRGNVEVVSDDGATISAYQARTGTVTANYGGSTSSAVLEYEITIPEDASSGDTYELSLRGSEDTEKITVGSGSGGAVASYANAEGFVGPGGLGDAAADFRTGEIGPGTLGKVAAAFRSGKRVA
jgi:hypothetical protein